MLILLQEFPVQPQNSTTFVFLEESLDIGVKYFFFVPDDVLKQLRELVKVSHLSSKQQLPASTKQIRIITTLTNHHFPKFSNCYTTERLVHDLVVVSLWWKEYRIGAIQPVDLVELPGNVYRLQPPDDGSSGRS
jgi:hypothetical protein